MVDHKIFMDISNGTWRSFPISRVLTRIGVPSSLLEGTVNQMFIIYMKKVLCSVAIEKITHHKSKAVKSGHPADHLTVFLPLMFLSLIAKSKVLLSEYL